MTNGAVVAYHYTQDISNKKNDAKTRRGAQCAPAIRDRQQIKAQIAIAPQSAFYNRETKNKITVKAYTPKRKIIFAKTKQAITDKIIIGKKGT